MCFLPHVTEVRFCIYSFKNQTVLVGDVMPRFSTTEKEHIRQTLLTEGERLFLTYGIKKVTIDDLAKVANIAKASFYVFYENKEFLFLDIVQTRQREVFDYIHSALTENRNMPSKERVCLVFGLMQNCLSEYPLLNKIDSNTVELISRKVPKERLNAFTRQNIDAAKILQEEGVKFSCDIETASHVFQALYHAWIFLHDSDVQMQKAVIEIMLEGIVNEIVAG
ncbi:MAG TPA: TetR/AcrR family transcriptional regulator [Ruminiclostridium sp.]|nr:TetR/AcrR family transcriptional regulator [Ruminiclostridium sp.]